MGAGFGMLLMVYIIGVMAAIAIPAYNGYITQAKVNAAMMGDTADTREACLLLRKKSNDPWFLG
jgi:Tfp pilus assembly protein PilE